MRARPGRSLPTIIVGGLLISGMALGMGSATAAAGDTCTSKGDTYDISTSTLVEAATDGTCQLKAGLTPALDDVLAGLSKIPKAPVVTTPPVAAVTTTPTKPATTTTAAAATTTTAPRAATNQPPLVVAGNGGVLVQANGATVAAGSFAGPVGALPPLLGAAPAGLASSLFSANAYDPGLLFGTPLGNAASALYSPKADSDVTTVSQAQAITAPGGGFGTPATIGVIILACLIGIAVRHRVISRMKARELPAGAEYQPRHAQPEQDEPELDEQPPADEARTLVVLTSR